MKPAQSAAFDVAYKPPASVTSTSQERFWYETSSPGSSHYACSSVPARTVYECRVPSTDEVFFAAPRIAALASTLCARTHGSASAESAKNALFVVYDLEKNKRPRDAARQLMLFVENNAKFHDIAATNTLLASMEPERLGHQSLTGVVRATARMKALLPAWEKSYSNAWCAVNAKGKNPRAMFIGMPAPSEDDLGSKSK